MSAFFNFIYLFQPYCVHYTGLVRSVRSRRTPAPPAKGSGPGEEACSLAEEDSPPSTPVRTPTSSSPSLCEGDNTTLSLEGGRRRCGGKSAVALTAAARQHSMTALAAKLSAPGKTAPSCERARIHGKTALLFTHLRP